jgi:hypothetical protein
MNQLIAQIEKIAKEYGLILDKRLVGNSSPQSIVKVLFQQIDQSDLSAEDLSKLQKDLERLLDSTELDDIEGEECSFESWNQAFTQIASVLDEIAQSQKISRDLLYLVSDFYGSKQQKIEICTDLLSPEKLSKLLKSRLKSLSDDWEIFVVRSAKHGGGSIHFLIGSRE